MRRRSMLGLAAVALAGCTGSNNQVDGSTKTTTPPSTTSTTPSTTTSTTREPCSTDIALDDPPEKPASVSASAEQIVRTVEPDVARDHFDPDGYFNFSLGEVSTTDVEEGVRVEARAEVDFSSKGDGENATTVHAHLYYDVTYRLTDRRVVRVSAEEGPTGTIHCW